jgi:hypothetical protein
MVGVRVGVKVAEGVCSGGSTTGLRAVAVCSKARRVLSKPAIAVSVSGRSGGTAGGAVTTTVTTTGVAVGCAAAVCAISVWLLTKVLVNAAPRV